jgi:DNA modification methylase
MASKDSAAAGPQEMELHPLAEAIPEMSTEEYRSLVDSIRRHGLREPIVTYQGKILDGRHRWRACQELGRNPRVRQFDGSLSEAIELVADANLRRRHLKIGQRAVVAIQLCTMTGSRGGRPSKTSSVEEVSRADIAKLVGVSPASVDRAIAISSEPDLVQAVRQGEMSLRAAEAELKQRKGNAPRADDDQEEAESPEIAAEQKPAKARRPASPGSDVLLDIPAPGYAFWARLLCADARDVLDSVERPDLIVTDPPYGIGLRHKKHGQMANDESMDVGYAVLALAIQKLKPGGMIYCFGDRKRPFNLAQAGGPLVNVLEPLIWDKGRQGTGDCSRAWGPSWEYISVGERLPGDDDADREVLRGIHERVHPDPQDVLPGSMRDEIKPEPPEFDPTDPKAIKAILRDHRVDRTRVRRPSVLRRPRQNTKRHPTEKPVELLKELVDVSSRPYDLVLDPFAGVGSTGVAALQLGRRFLGIELEEQYARIAAERLKSTKCEGIGAALGEEARWTRRVWEKLGRWWEKIEPMPDEEPE